MKNIIIVDHDEGVTNPLGAGLEKKKYFVGIAKRTSELMCLILRRVPDLVLIEANLHGVSGYGACMMVKEEFKDCPVIMMSNKENRGDMQRAFCSGADDYVTKPLDVERLYIKIQQLTNNGRKTNGVIKCTAGLRALSKKSPAL